MGWRVGTRWPAAVAGSRGRQHPPEKAPRRSPTTDRARRDLPQVVVTVTVVVELDQIGERLASRRRQCRFLGRPCRLDPIDRGEEPTGMDLAERGRGIGEWLPA